MCDFVRCGIVGTMVALALCAGPESAFADDSSEPLRRARDLRQTGRYEEAEESYNALLEEFPEDAALGKAHCLRGRGERDAATQVLKRGTESHPQTASFPAALAELAWERGDHDEAERFARQAVALDDDALLGRWVLAQLHLAAGRLTEAEAALEWLVDYYNRTPAITRPEDLRIIGLASAEYARWKRNSNQFRFLINTLYPDALRLDENYWPAHVAKAELYLEKFNQASAVAELNAALAINPNAAEIHTARAGLALQNYDLPAAQSALEQALRLDPRCVPALQYRADVHLANFQLTEAIAVLEEARP